MSHWKKTDQTIWTGRDDSAEGGEAKRLFQTIVVADEFFPNNFNETTALLGFACDDGVRINKGRVGAGKAPDILRGLMANLASTRQHSLVDMGTIHFKDDLASSQQALTDAVKACHDNGKKTIVLGGGHETAFAHGMGVYNAHPNKTVGIINFDAHLDIRLATEYSSGTPFKQLADYCEESNRPFNYLCVGAGRAANTQSLLNTAEKLGVKIIWDTECNDRHYDRIVEDVQAFIETVDIIYLTVDLDVLPPSYMFAVSAPSACGVEASFLLNLSDEIKATGKLGAIDFVEYLPELDRDNIGGRIAARFAWQIGYGL